MYIEFAHAHRINKKRSYCYIYYSKQMVLVGYNRVFFQCKKYAKRVKKKILFLKKIYGAEALKKKSLKKQKDSELPYLLN